MLLYFYSAYFFYQYFTNIIKNCHPPLSESEESVFKDELKRLLFFFLSLAFILLLRTSVYTWYYASRKETSTYIGIIFFNLVTYISEDCIVIIISQSIRQSVSAKKSYEDYKNRRSTIGKTPTNEGIIYN